MLKTRIVTAILLFCVFVAALTLFPPSGWIAFVTAIASVAAWEWGGLMALTIRPRILLGLAFASFCIAVAVLQPEGVGVQPGFSADAAWRLGRWFYVPAAFLWVLVVPLWIRQRWVLSRPGGGRGIGLLLGATVLLPTWLALVQLRQAGPLPLILTMAIVWLADIAAYFFGRAFGKHKLAPSISPGKTWEGALGGALAVVVYGLALAPELPDVLGKNLPLLIVVLVLLTAVSVMGDLFESLLKRQAGLKDSSNILPGHGGVLDRIDSLTSTLPLVAVVWLKTLL
jgi:phosphatidate cytidylyltransferase